MNSARGRRTLLCCALLAAFQESEGKLGAVSNPQLSTCVSSVYIYLDGSASISSNRKSEIADGLVRVFNQANTDVSGVVSLERDVTLLEFKESVSSVDVVDASEAPDRVTARIKNFFARTRRGEQSNLVDVLYDIESKVKTVSPGALRSTIFVIASDFEHDVTNGKDTDATRDVDYGDWKERSTGVLASLRTKFRAPQGPILLLVSSIRDMNGALPIGKIVLEDLEALAPYPNQIKKIGVEAVDLADFTPHFKPLALRLEVKNLQGENELVITPEQWSCISLSRGSWLELTSDPSGILGPIEVGTGPQGFLPVTVSIAEVERKLASILPFSSNNPLSDPDFSVQVVLREPGGRSIPFINRAVNKDEFILISDLRGQLSNFNRNVSGSFNVRAPLWSREVKVGIDLLLDGIKVGSQEGIPIGLSEDLSAPLRRIDFSIDNIEGVSLPLVCCDGEAKEDRLSFSFTVQGGADLLVQRMPMKASILNETASQKDLLQELVQQGSVPAFCTLFLLSVWLFFVKRPLGMGHVEEFLAVFGLFFLTLFFLLHRIPSIGILLDSLLMGGPAIGIGITIALFLAFSGGLMLLKGIIYPPDDRHRIVLSLHRRSLAARKWGGTVGRKSIFHRRELWALVMVLVALALGWRLYVEEPIPECYIEVVGERAALIRGVPNP